MWVEHLAANHPNAGGRHEWAAGPNHCGDFVRRLGGELSEPFSNAARRTEDQEFHLNVVIPSGAPKARSRGIASALLEGLAKHKGFLAPVGMTIPSISMIAIPRLRAAALRSE